MSIPVPSPNSGRSRERQKMGRKMLQMLKRNASSPMRSATSGPCLIGILWLHRMNSGSCERKCVSWGMST